MPKYEITDEVCGPKGSKLRRIRRLSDGAKGGCIESEKNLSQKGTCWVADNAQVYGNARVFEDAFVFQDAKVFGKARVYGNTWIFGNAELSSGDWVHGNIHDYQTKGSSPEEERKALARKRGQHQVLSGLKRKPCGLLRTHKERA